MHPLLIACLVAVLASPATAQEPPTLDPAGVRYTMRDEARMAGVGPGANAL